MRRKIVLYELLNWDGGDGRSNSHSGVVTGSKAVADAWKRQTNGNSVREAGGILIHSLDDMAEVKINLERARAMAKLTPRDRQLLGLSEGHQTTAVSDGSKLLAETQAAAFARAAEIMKGTDEVGRRGSAKVRFAHLLKMCEIGAANAGIWPADKTGRWLGYVQGCLAVRGLLDVDAERDLTRDDFRAAYTLMGLDVPKAVDLTEEAAG